MQERIVELRHWLTSSGLDAGPLTIAWHLEREGIRPPSTSTIRRILHAAGLIVPEPRKRPRGSFVRFEAAQPNGMWQSDFTHWRLADGTDVEVLNWLDDHSRFLLSCTAHTPVTGDDVVVTFLAAVDEFGCPAATLTDNGMVFTTRLNGGRNALEHLLPMLGVTQKNGKPGHPQTQGKVERFHHTLKRYLSAKPAAGNVEMLQAQLDEFRHHYNELRPHRARDRATPGDAFRASPKAGPVVAQPSHVMCAVALALVLPLVQVPLNALPWWSTPEGATAAAFIGWMYPFPVWLAFVLAGLALARSSLQRLRVHGAMVGIGAALAVATAAIDPHPDAPATDAGFWELALSGAPHSSGVLETVGSGGFAIAVLGLCLLVSRTPLTWLLLPIRAVGSMPLTAYTAQLLVWVAVAAVESVEVGDLAGFRDLQPFWWFTAFTLRGCTVWAVVFGRGPLENAIDVITRPLKPRA